MSADDVGQALRLLGRGELEAVIASCWRFGEDAHDKGDAPMGRLWHAIAIAADQARADQRAALVALEAAVTPGIVLERPGRDDDGDGDAS